MRLDASSICFVHVCSLHVISLCDFAYYVFAKSLQLLCILPLGILCLSGIRIMFLKIILAVCMLVGNGV